MIVDPQREYKNLITLTLNLLGVKRRQKIKISRNNLENRKFDKEAALDFCSEKMNIAQRQSEGEDKNSDAKSIQAKIDKTESSKFQPVLEAFDDVREFLKEIIPLHTLIPSDKRAKWIKESFRLLAQVSDVPIFVTDVKISFFQKLAKAISKELAPSALVDINLFEMENRWPFIFSKKKPKCILIPESLLWKSKYLLSHYKESAENRYLSNIPAILLLEPAQYTADLKRELWKKIAQQVLHP